MVIGTYARRLSGLSGFTPSVMPFNRLVPRGVGANLRWRTWVLEAARRDVVFAGDVWLMCASDPLFFVNGFCWTFDPRRSGSMRQVPFILYDYQEEALCELVAAKGMYAGQVAHDVLIEKSRDMGASWLCVVCDEWFWLFWELASFLWISRKEEYVDKTEDPKSLFWKADFILRLLPGFLRPRSMNRNKLHLYNGENGSTIDGESTTGESGRGDRRTSILLDEFAAVDDGERVLAATADSTNCRIFNSTPKGTGNAFYTVAASGIRKLRFHWSLHPEKGRGLWRDEARRWRSPWYDRECERRASRLEIAQELDIDYHASGSQFFDAEVLNRIEGGGDVQEPYLRGELEYEVREGPGGKQVEVKRFVKNAAGRLSLWMYPDGSGRPARDRNYVLGADVSAGSDASNSVVAVVDKKSGAKVGELCTIRVQPHDLAAYAVALAQWFGGMLGEGYLIWETNGPGQMFGAAVIDLGWRHFYLRKSEWALRVKRLRNAQPGFHSNPASKDALLGDLRHYLASRRYIERSRATVKEAREYVYEANGHVGFSPAAIITDPSGAKANHGDRVMATALACLALKEVEDPAAVGVRIPPNCFAARRQAFLDKTREARAGYRW